MFWTEPLRRHHIYRDRIITTVEPFLEAFSLSQFSYFTINSTGNSTCLSTHCSWIEYYLTQGLVWHNPFLKNPDQVPVGLYLARSLPNREYQETVSIAKKYGICDSLILIRKTDSCLHGYTFGMKSDKQCALLLNELPLLRKFGAYFEDKAFKTIFELNQNPIDVKPFLNDKFNSESFEEPFLNSKTRNKILTKLGLSPCPALSERENECLKLHLQGKSSRRIGEILDLSHRTVETYLENCKSKWGCATKEELLEKAPYFIR